MIDAIASPGRVFRAPGARGAIAPYVQATPVGGGPRGDLGGSGEFRPHQDCPQAPENRVHHSGASGHVGVEERSIVAVEGEVVSKVAKDRKSTRLNSSHTVISYAVFCLKKKN